MKLLIVLIIFIYGNFRAKAQNDTLYVYIEKNLCTGLTAMGKRKADPEPRTYYPFDGGRGYSMEKKAGKFKEYFRFFYASYTPISMDYQFSYELVDISILDKKDFKNSKWFNRTNYEGIINVFYGTDKVIYLIDERQILDSTKIYMVRVYFSFDAEE